MNVSAVNERKDTSL